MDVPPRGAGADDRDERRIRDTRGPRIEWRDSDPVEETRMNAGRVDGARESLDKGINRIGWPQTPEIDLTSWWSNGGPGLAFVAGPNEFRNERDG